MPEIRKLGLFIIAPNYRQSQIFLFNMDWRHRYHKVALRFGDLYGMQLQLWEVWWLDGMWPCSTHEEIEYMEYTKSYAKFRGADLHRWWT
jgi:hypothetical protein